MAKKQVERDKLFDHDFDGIKEYDNPLPTWWVWLWVGSMIFSVFYILWYHVGNGPSIYDKLEKENARFGDAMMAKYGNLKPDEETILKFMNDNDAMSAISSLFKGKCAQCHVADGSGNVGPNLTDDYYIHVKKITDIPDVITKGVLAKGMPPWEGQLTETQIVLLSSYVAY
ncbi:MAG TPA: cytochrome C oxidase Cbb3, partial [Phycisphaeraceae bacterium]|nr:cytochrome C oxidase Cbb3 [Phycisphaeraceae bacterium]